MQNTTKNEEPLLVYVKATTAYKPVHKTTETANMTKSLQLSEFHV